MKAELLLKRRVNLAEATFAELVLWRLPRMMPGSSHHYKYRLALVADNICVMRYANEAGKGDHRHIGSVESAYSFTDVSRLLEDFEHDVQHWFAEHSHVQDRKPE